MKFHSFSYFSLVFSFALQLTCLLKLKKPFSLRLLMGILCFGNVLSVLTRNHAILYWDQLWFIRMAAIVVFLWAVADVVSLPDKAPALLRIPVIAALVMAARYWPMYPENG